MTSVQSRIFYSYKFSNVLCVLPYSLHAVSALFNSWGAVKLNPFVFPLLMSLFVPETLTGREKERNLDKCFSSTTLTTTNPTRTALGSNPWLRGGKLRVTARDVTLPKLLS